MEQQFSNPGSHIFHTSSEVALVDIMTVSHYKAIILLTSILLGLTLVITTRQRGLRSSSRREQLVHKTYRSPVKARAFDSWPADRPLPCPPQWEIHSSEEKRRGFLFLRPFKCASSTTQSVNFRIARNEARRQRKPSPFCRVSAGHGPQPYPAADTFGDRRPEASVLWSVIREPTARAVSHFFYAGVRHGKYKANAEGLREDLFNDEEPNRPHNYYVRVLSLEHFHDDSDPIEFANQIMQDYDFIGDAERLDESLVVLKMLLNIPMADILHLDSKVSGGYKLTTDPLGCDWLQHTFISPEMQEVLDSPEWHESIKYDVLLHEAVNRSLDLTIDRLGRKEFEKNLVLYKRAIQEVKKRCVSRVTMPCSANGMFTPLELTDCIYEDMGCGNTCLDEVATDLGLW